MRKRRAASKFFHPPRGGLTRSGRSGGALSGLNRLISGDNLRLQSAKRLMRTPRRMPTSAASPTPMPWSLGLLSSGLLAAAASQSWIRIAGVPSGKVPAQVQSRLSAAITLAGLEPSIAPLCGSF